MDVVRVNDTFGEGQCEMKERASCGWSPCENVSETENRLLPCHTIPEQSTLRGQSSSWWTTPKCSVSGLPPISCFCDIIDFIHLFILMDCWWMNKSLKVLAFSSTCTERLLCSSLINVATAVWVFVFVCLYEQPTLTSRSQGHKTLNCFTMLQIITMTTPTAWKEKRYRMAGVETLQCYRNISNEAVFPMGYGLLVLSIPV